MALPGFSEVRLPELLDVIKTLVTPKKPPAAFKPASTNPPTLIERLAANAAEVGKNIRNSMCLRLHVLASCPSQPFARHLGWRSCWAGPRASTAGPFPFRCHIRSAHLHTVAFASSCVR